MKKTANTYIAEKLVFIIICYKRENCDSNFGHFFGQTRVKNWVTMETAYVPSDQKVYLLANNKSHKVSAIWRQPFLNFLKNTA